MKYCVIIPDGAADLPVARLDGKTPLEAARIPNLDRAAAGGLLGLVRTVPPRMSPASDVAIMSVMGYDPTEYYTGRGPLEAADLGVELADGEVACRCNLITTDGERLLDFCAGHISTAEADVLVGVLNEELGDSNVRFHTGTGYRHLMVYTPPAPLKAKTMPPHDVMGERLADILPRGKGSELLVDLIGRSAKVLADHEVNTVRRDLGQNPANMIWLWGQGERPALVSFREKYGPRGAAISAVNLVNGLARLVGWQVVHVPGSTGYLDTDYAAKGRYAVDALNSCDLVLVHVEAPDEASHEGDVKAKIRAIEQVDHHVVGPVMAAGSESGDLRMMVLPDHMTSVDKRGHMSGTVPFAIWGAGVGMRSGLSFTEACAAETNVVWKAGHELMGALLQQQP